MGILWAHTGAIGCIELMIPPIVADRIKREHNLWLGQPVCPVFVHGEMVVGLAVINEHSLIHLAGRQSTL